MPKLFIGKYIGASGIVEAWRARIGEEFLCLDDSPAGFSYLLADAKGETIRIDKDRVQLTVNLRQVDEDYTREHLRQEAMRILGRMDVLFDDTLDKFRKAKGV